MLNKSEVSTPVFLKKKKRIPVVAAWIFGSQKLIQTEKRKIAVFLRGTSV